MRKFLLPLFLLTCLTMTSQVGVGTITPNAALDITSTNDGILVPRIALVNTTTATVATPTTSEIVYNTATINDVTPGFYYWDGTVWVRILTGTNDDWKTNGNTSTTAGTNYIGTTDAVDLRIKTQATDRWNISNANNGQLQSYSLGTAALPTYSWQTDTNTGFFSSGADQLDFSTNATARFRIPAADQVHALSLGTAALPFYSFSTDTDTGVLSPGADQIDFSTGATARFRIPAANQVHALSLGTAALPFYTFSADPDTGLWSPTANNLSLSTNGTEKWRIDANGNIGVSQTLPKGILDIEATDRGIVFPRIALTASNVQAPVINPQTGTIPAGTVIYNTATAGTAPNNVSPGLYFWNGTRWYAFAGSSGGLDWSLNGNSSTVPGSYASPGANYLGTSDNTALHISTVGQPRMRITTNGNIGIGQSSLSTVRVGITPIATTDTALYATGTGSNSGSLIATGRFENTAANYATSITSSTPSVPTLGSPNIAIRAASGSSSFISPTASTNIGVASNATNIAFYGITEGTTDTNRRAAEFRTNDAGASTDSDANDPIAYLAGYGNNANVDGTNTRSLKYGGYFYGGNASAYAYVGARLGTPITGNSNYKIIGPGVVSTIVSSERQNDNKKIMFAPEAPEVLFEDYGTGRLVDGIAEIKIDPILAKNIHVDNKRPLKVFIQLEGDCNGVFVTNKSKTGFTVKELQNGKSNVDFSWHIVANRADETEANGEKTIYQSLRFPDAPETIKPTASESKKIQSTKPDSDSEVKTENEHTPN